MYKKYIVRLTDCERQLLGEVVRKLKGTSEKVRRAQVLLKADADGPHGKDAHIAEACDCRVRTIEHVRQRLVVEGLDAALERAKRDTPPTPKLRLLPISLREFRFALAYSPPYEKNPMTWRL